MIGLLLLDTVEYLKPHNMRMNISLYNVWVVDDSIKISLFSVCNKMSTQCPCCSYSGMKEYYLSR